MYTMLSGIFLGLHSPYAFTKKMIFKKRDALGEKTREYEWTGLGMEDLKLAAPPLVCLRP